VISSSSITAVSGARVAEASPNSRGRCCAKSTETFGWLADRFGRKRLFVATLVMYSTATVISAFSPTFLIFLIFRFVTAMGVGGEYSAVMPEERMPGPMTESVPLPAVIRRQIPLHRHVSDPPLVVPTGTCIVLYRPVHVDAPDAPPPRAAVLAPDVP